MDLFATCPQLIVQNANQTLYEGFLDVSGQEFHIVVELPDRSLQLARISCDWELKHLLTGYERLIEQRLQHTATLADFMEEFKTIVERLVEDSEVSHTASPHFYSLLLGELEDIGWHRLSYIDANFQWLHLEAKDSSERSHILKVHLHPQHPEVAPDCVAELPLPFHFISTANNSLKTLFGQFEQCLEQYQEFWDAIDEVDSGTWVLEPEKPTRSATVRRIALGKKTFYCFTSQQWYTVELNYLCDGLLLFSTVELNYLCDGLLLFSTIELNYLCDGLLLFSTVELNYLCDGLLLFSTVELNYLCDVMACFCSAPLN
ncbi:E3 ubiquitin-protein ligase FANCL [Lamellibrachia satsuma]|nr:E3 ubiquitin-protein ligase FANCL [Lamellibrachia satsuma]